MISLREYQAVFADLIWSSLKRFGRTLAVLATGGGKTVVFAWMIRNHVGASAAVVHRKEIVVQISRALARMGVKHRVIAPPHVLTSIRRKHLKEFGRSYVDPGALCGVVSVQTITSASAAKNEQIQAWVRQVTFAVFDEGHHYVRSGFWARAVDMLSGAMILFVTATPERADGKGLGESASGFARDMVVGPSVKDLQDMGYLCKFQYFAPVSDFSVDGVPTTASGDLNTKELRKRVVKSHLVGDVVEHYKTYLSGKRAIVFATDVATADEMAFAFTRAGMKAAALSGDTDDGVRDATIDDFEANRLQVLINVDLFDEGFDVPAADGVILARPTESLAKLLQMVGRVLRPVYAEGFSLDTPAQRHAAMAAGVKPYAVVIDPVRNWERHGMANWPRAWSLDGKESSGRKRDTLLQRVCLACTQPYPAYEKICPYCGTEHVPGGRSAPEQVDGDLQELDVDAMAALFEKIKKANMPEDEFRQNQIARNVPPIGRGAELSRYRATLYRRQVLRELIAWWVGCQPNRSTSEVQRRFYHRFHVDMGTALTLTQDKTDQLIELITQRFHEDMI